MLNHSSVVANPIVRISPRVQMTQETLDYYAKVASRYSLANPGALKNLIEDSET